MLCVEIGDYSIIINMDKVGPIIYGRGPRQGVMLSRDLFILCFEGLSALIMQSESRGDINGVKICKYTPI